MTFERWVQKRLRDYGQKITVDGDWGRQSIQALKRFQSARGIPATGLANRRTVEALQEETLGLSMEQPPVQTLPPWMAELWRRRGLHEVRDNAVLATFLRLGRYLGNPRTLPWCGDCVESALVKALPEELMPSNPFWAQGWASWGRHCLAVDIGAVGVIRWSEKAGHVGFVAGGTPRKIWLLGGNQNNAINVAAFPRSKFIAFRWPKTYAMKRYQALVRPDGELQLTSESTR